MIKDIGKWTNVFYLVLVINHLVKKITNVSASG